MYYVMDYFVYDEHERGQVGDWEGGGQILLLQKFFSAI